MLDSDVTIYWNWRNDLLGLLSCFVKPSNTKADIKRDESTPLNLVTTFQGVPTGIGLVTGAADVLPQHHPHRQPRLVTSTSRGVQGSSRMDRSQDQSGTAMCSDFVGGSGGGGGTAMGGSRLRIDGAGEVISGARVVNEHVPNSMHRTLSQGLI